MQRRDRSTELAGMPSQINMHPISSRVFRFGLNASQQSSTITRLCMLSLQSVIGPGITQALTIIQSIRIKRVSIWCTSAAGNNLDSFSIEWLDEHGPSTQKTGSCTQMIAGHLVSRPPANSFAGLWSQVTSTTTYNEALFMINVLPKAIVDVECELVYSDGLQAQNESIARNTAGLPPGVAYAALDNATITGVAGTQTLGPFADYEVTYI